ncbi:MAG: hypothetical protein RL653_48 [Pseudomonadota bacterium]|jgi:DNA sulfur modification protein DndD
MHLAKVELVNWKAYVGEQAFRFPAPTRRKNVVLVGAPNGFGKTSLLEAIAIGLYGREGLGLVARADSSGDQERKRQSYRAFLQSAWSTQAIDEADLLMKIELTFEDSDAGDDATIVVSRSWTFSNAGVLGDGEELSIFKGLKRRRIVPGKHDEPEDYFRSWIARHLMPSHLAQFFLFDGERVQALANRDMASQVRMGIEGFLGVRLLRDLDDDLDKYVRKERSGIQSVHSDTLHGLRTRRDEIESSLVVLGQRATDLEQERNLSQKLDEDLKGRLGSMGGGSVASVKRLLEQKQGVRTTIDSLTEKLLEVISGDLSIALAGRVLRDQLLDRLNAERKLEESRSAMETGSAKVERFIHALEGAHPAFDPSLTEAQRTTLAAKVRSAWTAIWNPPDEGCASSIRHSSLSNIDRSEVSTRLGRVRALGDRELEDLLHRLDHLREDESRLERQINSLSGIEEPLRKLTEEFTQSTRRTAELHQSLEATRREIAALQRELGETRARLTAEENRLELNKPLEAKLALAERIRELIGPFIEEATAERVNDIAERMTEAFGAMAHKSLVRKIEISDDCQVRLLTPENFDVRSLDASAGENQVFAFALISAIHQAAAVRFPLIIDTPLARLDARHRENVLRHFADNGGEQIIFLSQDTEIVREFKAVLESRIAKTYRIDTEKRGRRTLGRARLLENEYFS